MQERSVESSKDPLHREICANTHHRMGELEGLGSARAVRLGEKVLEH